MLSPFVFLTDPAQPRANLILHTLPPFPVVQVWMFEKQEDYINFVSRNDSHMMAHFKIAFTQATSLECKKLDDDSLLREAANFYFNERIMPNRSRFKRYEAD